MDNRLVDWLMETFEELPEEEMLEQLKQFTSDEFIEVANLIITLQETPDSVKNAIFAGVERDYNASIGISTPEDKKEPVAAPATGIFQFVVGNSYEFPGLYGPSYNVKCTFHTETHVTFSDGFASLPFEIIIDGDSERVTVWEYKEHEGYCWAEPEESRMKKFMDKQ